MSNVLWMGINVTFNCNLKCPHCYLRLKPTAPKLSDMVISKDTIARLKCQLQRHVGTYGMPIASHFCTFGGEPLLYENNVRLLISSIKDVLPNSIIGLNTNGYRLNSAFLSWFKDLGEIQYGIGDFPIEDVDSICRFVTLHKVILRPTIVLTETNLKRLTTLVKLVHEYTPLVVLRNLIGTHSKTYRDLYHKHIVEVMNWMLEDDRNLFHPQYLWEVAMVMNKGPYRPLCGTRYVTINPDGTVGMCCAQDTVIGNLWDEDFDFCHILDDNKYPVHHYAGIKECEKCDVREVCGGGCPYIKELNKTKVSPNCTANKEIIPLLLKIKERWLSKEE